MQIINIGSNVTGCNFGFDIGYLGFYSRNLRLGFGNLFLRPLYGFLPLALLGIAQLAVSDGSCILWNRLNRFCIVSRVVASRLLCSV